MSLDTDRIERDLDESRHRLNDTLNQLGKKLSPGQILDEGLGLLQGQAGHFAANLGRQVRENPLPTVLVAAGVAWLMMSKNRSHESRSQFMEDPRHRSLEDARTSTQRIAGETDEAYEERVHLAYARALNMEQEPEEHRSAFLSRVKNAVSGIKHAASDTKRRVGGAVSGAASGAKHAVSGATRAMKGSSRKVGEAVSGVRHSAEDLYDTNPLAIGALMFGLGVLLGGAAPLSQVERRSLQRVADVASREGAKVADRGAEMLQKSVH